MFLTFWQVFITIPQPAVFPQIGSMFLTLQVTSLKVSKLQVTSLKISKL